MHASPHGSVNFIALLQVTMKTLTWDIKGGYIQLVDNYVQVEMPGAWLSMLHGDSHAVLPKFQHNTPMLWPPADKVVL